MPDIARTRPETAQFLDDIGTELGPPTPNDLVRHLDPAFQQHLLAFANAAVKADIEPNRVSDDFRRKLVAILADPGCRIRNRDAASRQIAI